MKIEINSENKAKFFALYWGQKIMTYPAGGLNGAKESIDIVSWLISSGDINSYYLCLKPLSSISDEDAIEVARIVHTQFGKSVEKIVRRENKISIHTVDHVNPHEKYLTLIWFESSNVFVYAKQGDNQKMIACWNQVNVIDYLRSRSYLLPWIGLSCEEIIEAGWAKYQE